jgi:hypothetical protein
LNSKLSEDVTLLRNSVLFSKYPLLCYGVRNDWITHQAAYNKSNFTDVYKHREENRVIDEVKDMEVQLPLFLK